MTLCLDYFFIIYSYKIKWWAFCAISGASLETHVESFVKILVKIRKEYA